MEIVQEIGSYAGFAAIIGLAVLSALYFSQARDVRRLRDWAGRAPERTSEPAAQPTRVVARPVPKAPGTGGASPGAPGGAQTPAPAAVAAATGAAGSVATNAPAAATPAAARAATAGDNGGEAGDGEGVSQDTMSHPPPLRDGEDPPEDEPDSGEFESGEFESVEFEADSSEFEGATPAGDSAELDPDAEDLDVDGDDDADDPGEESEERDAVAPPPAALSTPRPKMPVRPVPPPPRTAPLPPRSAPVTLAGRTPPGAAPGQRAQPGGGTPILPPYERSRPDGSPPARGFFSSPARGALVIGLGVLVLAAATLGGLELAGGGDDSSTDSTGGAGQVADQGGTDGGESSGGRPAIDPSQVTVAVLNGTTVTGLAADVGDSVEAAGYQLGNVTNSLDQERAESVVFYAPGAEAEAKQVGESLKISQREEIDPDTQALAGDASIVVVVGADRS